MEEWFQWVYQGGVRARAKAVRRLRSERARFSGDAWVACATGDVEGVRRALEADKLWGNRAGGPMGMPPMVAVTHSMLMLEPGFAEGLLASARLLIENGADVNVRWLDPRFPEWPLSALYGAAGRTHSAAMVALLLKAGANPDDNESVYHSVEGPDSACLRLLLEAGATVNGTNGIARALDCGRLEDLRLMLDYGGDASEKPWIHHAVRRGRSIQHVQALVEAGAPLAATNDDRVSLYRWAQIFGRDDVVSLLKEFGVTERLTLPETFVAACSRGFDEVAKTIVEQEPEIFAKLSEGQLQMLPLQAAIGNQTAVRTMLALGWPREVKVEWGATALNQAVYRGDAAMAELLLVHGADWRTEHNFGDNVVGTLDYASRWQPEDLDAPRDFVGCATVLVRHGVPLEAIAGHQFSDEVEAFFGAQKSEDAAD